MEFLNKIDVVLKMVQETYKKHKETLNPLKIEKYIKLINYNLRLISVEVNTNQILTNANKKHMQAVAGQLSRYEELFNQLLKGKTGAGAKLDQKGSVIWRDLTSAFQSRLQTSIIINLIHKDLNAFFEDCFTLFWTNIKKHISTTPLKINMEFCAEFTKPVANTEELLFKEFTFNTKNYKLLFSTLRDRAAVNEWFQKHISAVLMEKITEFEEQGSGWTLSKIMSLTVNINKVMLYHASSYIDLPKEIKLKKAIINVQNNDEACFGWALVSALYPVPSNSPTHRVNSYPYYGEVLNFEGINFPMSFDQLSKFLKQNPNISINIYGLIRKSEKNYVTVPLYLCDEKKQQHVNLLMIQESYEIEKENDEIEDEIESDQSKQASIKYHFCWIKNLSRLVKSQLTSHRRKTFICDRCLHYFHNEQKLNIHEIDCRAVNKCKIILPKPGTTVHFKNHHHKLQVPFTIYADLECLLKDFKDDETKDTIKYKEHTANSIAYYLHSAYDNSLSRFRLYRGENCVDWFANELSQIADELQHIFDHPKPMDPLLDAQEREFKLAPVCHICEEPFLDDHIRVRDHCHFTGRYRGSAHMGCNLNHKIPHRIPIFFHNFSGYDAHFLIKTVATAIPGRVSLLPKNKERYISITKNIPNANIQFRFLDSFRFMSDSLEKLVSYLDFNNLKILRNICSDLSSVQLKLLIRKGVYPYEYMDNWEKFNDTELPDKKHFYSKLKNSHISEEDYNHAQELWKTFNIKNLGEYSDIYLKTDVLLLADVFQNFRENLIKTHGLDPAHYFTSPSYTWDAMLKHTKIKLELVTDVDMLLFLERGIRGGISQVCTRYSKANNKYLPNYNPKLPNKYLLYLDANNLYGWAMSQSLPYKDFKWLSDKQINDLDSETILNIPTDIEKGLIYEVDLDYPNHLHDYHNMPFCSEHKAPPNSKQKKLLTTLEPKTRYVIHHSALKQCLQEGLILRKIHRAISFTQACWLKDYIDLNTKLRSKAKNEFEKNLFKLLNNAIFGKSVENVRKYRNVKLCTKWNGRYGANQYISKPNFHSRTIFSEDLVAVELNKLEILFNKPIYVGMAVLDISKTLMYDFHYQFMLKQFNPKNCKLLYMDTDSLLYEITCDDVYEVIKNNINMFDTSDYAKDNPFNIPLCNKKVLGLMKDENKGYIMYEFVGLKAKMYAIQIYGLDVIKKAKGVVNQLVKHNISFDDYLSCFKDNYVKIVNQSSIQSKQHNVYSVEQKKKALSNEDNKRFILDNGIDTLPWGHYRINDELMDVE